MKVLVVAVFAVFAHAQQFKCPVKDGSYEDSIQCDKYYECYDGIATPKLCPDGLVFNPAIKKINKCDQPFSVECGDRVELQPAHPSGLCPRRNGFFAHPDQKVCNLYYICVEGISTKQPCPPGLHFDEFTGTCVWPEVSGREGCDASETMVLKDGFKCPKEGQVDSNGQLVVHPKYAHPNDCQRFYVCLNGIEPRDLGCTTGEVYNDETQKCDAPENVTGCEDWYKDDQPPKSASNKKQ